MSLSNSAIKVPWTLLESSKLLDLVERTQLQESIPTVDKSLFLKIAEHFPSRTIDELFRQYNEIFSTLKSYNLDSLTADKDCMHEPSSAKNSSVSLMPGLKSSELENSTGISCITTSQVANGVIEFKNSSSPKRSALAENDGFAVNSPPKRNVARKVAIAAPLISSDSDSDGSNEETQASKVKVEIVISQESQTSLPQKEKNNQGETPKMFTPMHMLDELANATNQHRDVVIYSLYTHNGDIAKAYKFLVDKSQKVPEWDWLEDMAIMENSDEKAFDTLKTKSKDQIEKRRIFIGAVCSS